MPPRRARNAAEFDFCLQWSICEASFLPKKAVGFMSSNAFDSATSTPCLSVFLHVSSRPDCEFFELAIVDVSWCPPLSCSAASPSSASAWKLCRGTGRSTLASTEPIFMCWRVRQFLNAGLFGLWYVPSNAGCMLRFCVLAPPTALVVVSVLVAREDCSTGASKLSGCWPSASPPLVYRGFMLRNSTNGMTSSAGTNGRA
mmetsp:Transcript_4978/g.10960  ORF Transcript_4978/g.10960 Transcript_4978/m.10960 type:complete len:200 (+) Transcript_4978:163-762(+)|eukprot:CAMPEP_0119509446 /NCGR_PEP_ID=MMETSP1344-20130328/28734_1 /TAXON_ID=236787 /ORGANISM="Florenciella parvula, Strain CCMP2471" /LENGTH=199 /DNA_ID=CAMNT_0007546275 /DNA_START=187 /DNA_END=786 /DNA_ORIENTATION=+